MKKFLPPLSTLIAVRLGPHRASATPTPLDEQFKTAMFGNDRKETPPFKVTISEDASALLLTTQSAARQLASHRTHRSHSSRQAHRSHRSGREAEI